MPSLAWKRHRSGRCTFARQPQWRLLRFSYVHKGGKRSLPRTETIALGKSGEPRAVPQLEPAPRCSAWDAYLRAIRRELGVYASGRNDRKRNAFSLSQHHRHRRRLPEHGKCELQQPADLVEAHGWAPHVPGELYLREVHGLGIEHPRASESV